MSAEYKKRGIPEKNGNTRLFMLHQGITKGIFEDMAEAKKMIISRIKVAIPINIASMMIATSLLI